LTDGALNKFVVNAPATLAGTSLTMSAQSFFVEPGLIPAATPEARNPLGAVTPPSIRIMASSPPV
jgi:hypothetical protein